MYCHVSECSFGAMGVWCFWGREGVRGGVGSRSLLGLRES